MRQAVERPAQGRAQMQRRDRRAILATAGLVARVGVEDDVQDDVVIGRVEVVPMLAPARAAQVDLQIAAP